MFQSKPFNTRSWISLKKREIQRRNEIERDWKDKELKLLKDIFITAKVSFQAIQRLQPDIPEIEIQRRNEIERDCKDKGEK